MKLVDYAIGAVLFITPEVAPYFWPVVSFVLLMVIVILLRV